MVKTYDTKSLELAQHFLQDYRFDTDAQRASFAKRLAMEIQFVVEAWTEDYCAGRAK